MLLAFSEGLGVEGLPGDPEQEKAGARLLDRQVSGKAVDLGEGVTRPVSRQNAAFPLGPHLKRGPGQRGAHDELLPHNWGPRSRSPPPST
jgi:hypothetical protein